MDFYLEHFWKIVSVAPTTLLLSISAMIIGMMIAVCCAFMLIYQIPVISKLVTLYLSVMRGTPLLVHLFIAYYGIPQLADGLAEATGLPLSVNSVPPIIFAIIALSLERSAYLTEAIRSALLSVPKGQLEAAHAVGMTTAQAYLRIVFPQALVVALPNLTNLFLGGVKGSSLASVVAVVEMMNMANIEATDSYRFMEIYIILSLIYWGMCIGFEQWLSRIETRVGYFRKSLRN
ncbi:amino acid ABC transporter permease [Paenibacillus sanguinis]|uniref:amino acid ABC transporter permease n=1 Tax=Paenibacillus sanguinis TaxID=225906 RepID=UPI000361A17C|nr:amino acid ABC transporter permease [Paenibacillus sanguinis]